MKRALLWLAFFTVVPACYWLACRASDARREG